MQEVVLFSNTTKDTVILRLDLESAGYKVQRIFTGSEIPEAVLNSQRLKGFDEIRRLLP